MGFFEFVVAITAISIMGSVIKAIFTERRDKRRLEQKIRLAQLQTGLALPEASGGELKQLQSKVEVIERDRRTLERRLEQVETIVTSPSRELNLRLERLLSSPAAPAFAAGGSEVATLPPHSLLSGQLGFAAPSRVGELFADRYQLLSELGRGGMGVVYKARDTRLDQMVTLKVLSPLVASDPKAWERFRHEASATRSIDHPNVIRIYDLGEEANEPYISMEFFPSIDLKSRLQQLGPLPQPECLRIAEAVARGIQAAHDLGVIHRDLKPQNILFGRQGRIKVIDFGLAKSSLMAGLTMSGFILGTPQYMSPE